MAKMAGESIQQLLKLQKKKAGYIKGFTGGMFNRKSGMMVLDLWDCIRVGERVDGFMHMKNTRESMITSRMLDKKEGYPAIKVWGAFEIFQENRCKSDKPPRYVDEESVNVAFDECQFFGSEIITVIKILFNAGRRIMVAGLDLTDKGDPFGAMPAILAMADEPGKGSSTCQASGCRDKSARKSLYVGIAPKTGDVKVEGNGQAYEARCNLHWDFQFTPEEFEMIEGLDSGIKAKIIKVIRSNRIEVPSKPASLIADQCGQNGKSQGLTPVIT